MNRAIEGMDAVLLPDGTTWVTVAWQPERDNYVMIPEGALVQLISAQELHARKSLGYVQRLPKGSDKAPKLAPLGSDFDPWLGV